MKTGVEDAITHSGLFARGDHVLAAVSGGADSVAMLCALEAAAPQLGIAVSVGHFDHRLRAESAREGETLAALCATRGIAYHTGSEDVAARARESGESIEAAARRYRYRFLEATRKRVGATHIATAHTRDDQVETILMRVLRGAGIRGLCGIPQRRGAIVRPLLDVTHTDTLACCAAFGVSYVDDPSNQDRTHTRNLIRHEMLPQLRAWNADVDRNILHMGENAALAVAGVRRLTTPLLDRAVSREANGAWVVDTRALAGLDALACHVFFADLLAERMGCECDAGRVHYERLAELSQPALTGDGLQLRVRQVGEFLRPTRLDNLPEVPHEHVPKIEVLAFK
ncbi:MAG: tRNA lysidine(34) synthetase TilS [Candidatus Krumholzibacteriota bacterium]|nr:tRNA lysidine(34) synthetase TilS [Candidatus Krumholzibacteriota bacterium]